MFGKSCGCVRSGLHLLMLLLAMLLAPTPAVPAGAVVVHPDYAVPVATTALVPAGGGAAEIQPNRYKLYRLRHKAKAAAVVSEPRSYAVVSAPSASAHV